MSRHPRQLRMLVSAVALTALLVPTTAAASPTHHLRIRAVLTADDDGSDAATVTAAQIQTRVANANTVWAGAGLVLDFDPATDIELRNSTLLRNDCTPVAPDACLTGPNKDERERIALDDQHDGRITVYFRFGGGSPHSSRQAHYIVMGGSGSGSTTLAHELGHYLWNRHTFASTPGTLAEAAQKIKAYVEGSGAAKSSGLDVFDNDLLGGDAADTPPDPGPELWTALKGDACASGPGAGTHPVSVLFSDSTVTSYTLAPDRSNIMSYFNCANLGHTSSPQQQSRARAAVEQWNRTQLIGQTPGYFDPSVRWSGTRDTGADSVVAFTRAQRRYLLSYDAATGNARVDEIRADPDHGFDTIWTGLFQTGWTSLVPFELDGVPHLLLYKASDGKAKIVTLLGAQGVSSVWTGQFQTNWTHLMGFELAGKPQLLLYKAGDGTAKAVTLLGAQGISTLWTGLFQTGWTHLTGLEIAGKPHLLVYRGGDGSAKLVSVGAQGVSTVWTSLFKTGWTSFVPFDRGSRARFLVYNAATGFAKAVAVTAAGVDGLWQGNWSTGYDVLTPTRLDGQWNAYPYDAATGSARIVDITQ